MVRITAPGIVILTYLFTMTIASSHSNLRHSLAFHLGLPVLLVLLACLSLGYGTSLAATPPIVTTGAVASVNVTTLSASVGGSVNPNGLSTTCKVDYGTTISYGSTTGNVSPAPGSGTSVVSRSETISGLTANTLYHYRFDCTNASGEVTGADATFQTQAPSVTTQAATSLGSTTATLNGSVTPEGNTTSCSFQYGTTTSYGTTVNCAASAGNGESPVAESTNLTGLTANTTYHYQLTASNVTGSSNVGGDQTFTTAASVSPPTNTVAPVVSGTATDKNGTLTTDNGTFTGTGLTYTYQWQRCSDTSTSCSTGTWQNISGATSSSYTPQDADTSFELDVVVTATNSGGSASGTSAATANVASITPSNSTIPVISGTTTDGQTLTTTPGSWTGSSSFTYTYQWQQCSGSSSLTCSGGTWNNISGATSSSYIAQDTDVGLPIQVTVTATGTTVAAGSTTVDSSGVGPISPGTPTNTVAPVISGTPTDGQTLSTTNGTWTGDQGFTYKYQWQRCSNASTSCSTGSWANISGATNPTYKLQDADAGLSVQAVITATGNKSGTSVSADSASVAVASNVPVNTATPTISGTTTDGQTLTATTGTWTGNSITYTYQWQRCSNTSTSCSSGTWQNISGATGNIHQLQDSDTGFALDIVVTATNTSGAASVSSSATTTVASTTPVNSAAPTISGTGTDGQTLSASTGTWTGSSSFTYTYQWERCSIATSLCSGAPGTTSQEPPAAPTHSKTLILVLACVSPSLQPALLQALGPPRPRHRC